ncbi:carboxylesterase/lipase family protein [Saccharopolyspora erythraea]|nr:carboxylesterase family protein [Saccharopolyspora erythraea]EQD84699.1 carboxylesterase [Saccharopolyspora erythraea D]
MWFMDVIVRTGSGRVRGFSAGDVSVFKGIPYAAPLDGPARFQAPLPAPSWEGVRDSTAFSASVPQEAAPMPGQVSPWKPGDSTECLTVNVWSPDVGARGLPVLVWIHGGMFMHGSSASPAYDGAALAREGVVFVSLNYRVGYEGFGWVADAPANRGLLDQIAALRWVRDNIAGFGGDPGNVTVAGQSAGGSSVVALVSSPAARGLLRRGIAQSVGGLFVPEAEARAVAEMVTDQLGVSPTAAELGSLPSEAIHGAQSAPSAAMTADPSAWTNSHTPYAPMFGDDVLERRPWEALRAGAGREIDLIAGFTRDECRVFAAGLDLSGSDPVAVARGMRLAPEALPRYRAAHPGISDAGLHELMLTDSLFRMPTLWCAEGHAEAGGKTYLYEFAWPAPVLDGAYGACHSIDVPFLFGVLDDEIGRPLLGDPAPAGFEVLSAQLRRAWTSFAASGDPGWPEFGTDWRLARSWNVPLEVVSDPAGESRRIWREHA